VPKLKITLTRSTFGALKKQKATIEAMGLRKIGQTVELENNPSTLGMVHRVAHMVKCEEA